MQEFITDEIVVSCYQACKKRKSNTENAMEFSKDLAKNLAKLKRELNTRKYKVGRSIAFIVDHPVKREVFAADFRDRIVHHIIMYFLYGVIDDDFIEDSYSCRVNKGTHYGIKRCATQLAETTKNYTNTAWVFKGDFSGFFMSIDKNILHKKVERCIALKYSNNKELFDFLVWLTGEIIFNCPQDDCIFKQPLSRWEGLDPSKSLRFCPRHIGLPIGNLTSQIFANLYLSDFDKYIKGLEGVRGYGRYVDDWFVICDTPERCMKIVDLAEKYLKTIHVRLHPKKRYLQEAYKGLSFIGGVIKPNRIYVRNRTKGNFYHTLSVFASYVKNNTVSRNDIVYMRSCINSSLGTMGQFKTYKLRKKMLTSDNMKTLASWFEVSPDYLKVVIRGEKSKRKKKRKRNSVVSFYL